MIVLSPLRLHGYHLRPAPLLGPLLALQLELALVHARQEGLPVDEASLISAARNGESV